MGIKHHDQEPEVALLSSIDGEARPSVENSAESCARPPLYVGRHTGSIAADIWKGSLLQRIIAAMLCAALVFACVASLVDVRRTPLEACLAAAGVPLVTKASSAWPNETRPFNLRASYVPAAVAVPRSIQHIQDAVRCGAENSIRVSAKGGGHSFASFGLGGEDGHLVIALDRMNQVVLEEDNTTTIQPGARLGHIALELDQQGQRDIAHGICPGVGIGGHSLHGGLGMATRTHGLTLDWLIGAKLVLANGSLIECSETHNSDIFWALRGAGSSFGVVAELRFNTFPTQRELTRFTLVTKWHNGTAAAGLAMLQDYVFNAPRELNMMFVINSNGQQFVEGLFFGSQHRLKDLIAPLLNDTGVHLAKIQGVSWLEAQEYFAYGEPLDMTTGYNVTDTFYSKSAVTSTLTEAQLHQLSLDLFANLYDTSWPADTKWAYMMDLYGGPQSAVAMSNALSTSFAHRDKFLVHQFSLRSTNDYVASYGIPLMTQFSDSLLRDVEDDDWGLYINYVDPQIDAAKAPSLYYGSNLPKLESIKARVDGQDVFWNPHGVRPGLA